MSDSIDRIAEELLAEIRAAINPERAEFVKGYAPTAEGILGVAVPVVRKAARRARAAVKVEPVDVRVKLARRILAFGFLETRQATYELLAKDAPSLTVRQLEQVGKGIDNWATVDSFATVLAGPAWIAGAIDDADVMRWATSTNPWWRRAALASTVALNVPARGGHGDAARTIAICERLAGDDNVFVRKALSWSLRSLVRWDAAAVRQFLAEHPGLPRFVMREVSAALERD